jgi:acyl-CoA hydrolase
MSDPKSSRWTISTTRLVKGEDLNHHLTLYGGRCVEWAVQLAYIAAQNCFDDSRPIVFMSIRSLSMRSPAKLGDILELTGRVDYLGESTIGVRVDGRKLQPKCDPRPVVTGTFLLCTVDQEGKAVAHELPPLPSRSESTDRRWREAERQVALS